MIHFQETLLQWAARTGTTGQMFASSLNGPDLTLFNRMKANHHAKIETGFKSIDHDDVKDETRRDLLGDSFEDFLAAHPNYEGESGDELFSRLSNYMKAVNDWHGDVNAKLDDLEACLGVGFFDDLEAHLARVFNGFK